MARLAYAARGGLGDVAQHGMGADGDVAGLDMALGCPASTYNAIARTPAFGGLMMIEWAGCLPGPYGPGWCSNHGIVMSPSGRTGVVGDAKAVATCDLAVLIFAPQHRTLVPTVSHRMM